MLYKTRRCFVRSTIRWVKFQLENSFRSMSVTVDPITEPERNTMTEKKRPVLDDSNENNAKVRKVETDTEALQRIKRKNHAILLGYLGKDYYGMQRNPGMRTIEEDLVVALLKADLITEEHFKDIRSIKFQRAARTDKGVSAIRQIVSLKLPEKPDRTMINNFLPDVIRVFGIKRVTKNFNSKNQCDARTYRYVIPSFALAPEDPGLLKVGEDVNEEERIQQLSTIDGKPYTDYRLSPESLDRLNSVLKLMEGTHNFHNFTSKVKPLDPRAKRYIMNFRCARTFVSNDVEFVVLEVKGQSFMLHQIRKMVAFTVAIMRNIVSEETLNLAFETKNKMDIAIAPSLGLCLCHVHYETYDKRYGKDGLHETLDWEECEEEVEKFQKDYILSHIVDTEISEQTTLKWVANLPFYTFNCQPEEIPEEDDDDMRQQENGQ